MLIHKLGRASHWSLCGATSLHLNSIQSRTLHINLLSAWSSPAPVWVCNNWQDHANYSLQQTITKKLFTSSLLRFDETGSVEGARTMRREENKYEVLRDLRRAFRDQRAGQRVIDVVRRLRKQHKQRLRKRKLMLRLGSKHNSSLSKTIIVHLVHCQFMTSFLLRHNIDMTSLLRHMTSLFRHIILTWLHCWYA